MIARKYINEKAALASALFAYGNAKQICSFLERLDLGFSWSEEQILRQPHYYRFQKPLDVANFLITLKRADSLEAIFLEGYEKNRDVLEGLRSLIAYLRSLNPYQSYGYDFLLGYPPPQKTKGASPLKRWNMFLRWMVRKDHIDMGLWKGVDRSDLIIPLDTHTFKVSRKLGLLKRNRKDLQAALELTESLRQFDPNDPVRFDFALYRLGQENLV